MKSSPVKAVFQPRPRYWLPALFTTLTLWFGLAAVLCASRGALAPGAYAMLAALLTDNLDGRVARMTGSTSQFGKEYDSLSDMVAFGVAPAFATAYALPPSAGVAAWLVGLAYATCAGLRLARFNAVAAQADATSRFTGLPSPVAAAIVACAILLGAERTGSDAAFHLADVALIVTTLVAGLSMVSSMPFASVKSLSTRRAVQLLTGLAALAAGSSYLGLFGWFLAVALAGYLLISVGLLLRIPQE